MKNGNVFVTTDIEDTRINIDEQKAIVKAMDQFCEEYGISRKSLMVDGSLFLMAAVKVAAQSEGRRIAVIDESFTPIKEFTPAVLERARIVYSESLVSKRTKTPKRNKNAV
jgi:hypothetical protein